MKARYPVTRPIHFFITGLLLPIGGWCPDRARELLAELRESGHLAGRNPCGVAAGCLYGAAREANYPLTQKRVAKVADVTPVTVRGTYRELKPS